MSAGSRARSSEILGVGNLEREDDSRERRPEHRGDAGGGARHHQHLGVVLAEPLHESTLGPRSDRCATDQRRALVAERAARARASRHTRRAWPTSHRRAACRRARDTRVTYASVVAVSACPGNRDTNTATRRPTAGIAAASATGCRRTHANTPSRTILSKTATITPVDTPTRAARPSTTRRRSRTSRTSGRATPTRARAWARPRLQPSAQRAHSPALREPHRRTDRLLSGDAIIPRPIRATTPRREARRPPRQMFEALAPSTLAATWGHSRRSR